MLRSFVNNFTDFIRFSSFFGYVYFLYGFNKNECRI